MPESLHTADSGARLPCSTRMWFPAGLNGLATEKSTCCGVGRSRLMSSTVGTAARFSATVLPVRIRVRVGVGVRLRLRLGLRVRVGLG